MPVTFKTKPYANITMLADVANKMLEMMRFGTKVPGAIDAEDIPAALDNLQQALARVPKKVEPAGDADEGEPAVSLHTRAVPLIELLKSAAADQTYVRWE